VGYAPYTYPHVIVQLQLLLFSALAFAWLNLVGVYPPELHSVNLDADWLYRRLGARLAAAATQTLESALRLIVRPVRFNARKVQQALGPNSVLSRSAETGTSAFLVGALLAGYLLTYYLSS
jgi:multicomponent Na+:H+ antiporter subunit D